MSASALKPARRWPRYLAGGLALLFLLLSYRVIRQRLATGASLGDGAGTVSMGEERNASPLFAKNLANFLDLMIQKDGTLKIDDADECIKGTMIARDGALVHAMFKGA